MDSKDIISSFVMNAKIVVIEKSIDDLISHNDVEKGFISLKLMQEENIWLHLSSSRKEPRERFQF